MKEIVRLVGLVFPTLLFLGSSCFGPSLPTPPNGGPAAPPVQELMDTIRVACTEIPFQTRNEVQFEAKMSELLGQAIGVSGIGTVVPSEFGIHLAKNIITPAARSGMASVKDQLYCRVRVFATAYSVDVGQDLDTAWEIGPEKAFLNITEALGSSINPQDQLKKINELNKVAQRANDLPGTSQKYHGPRNVLVGYNQATGTLNFAESIYFQAHITGIVRGLSICGSYADKVVAAFPPSTFTAMDGINQAIRQYLGGFLSIKATAAMMAEHVYAVGTEIIRNTQTQTVTPEELRCPSAS